MLMEIHWDREKECHSGFSKESGKTNSDNTDGLSWDCRWQSKELHITGNR